MASSHCTAGASATSLRSKARSVPQPQHHAAPHGHHAWTPGVENPQLHVLNGISSKVAVQICRESRSDPSQSPARTCPVSRHPRPHDDTSFAPLPGQTELRERALARSDSAVAAPSFPPSNPSPVPACPPTRSHKAAGPGGSGDSRSPGFGQDVDGAREFSHRGSCAGSTRSEITSILSAHAKAAHTFVLATLGQTRWPGSSPSSGSSEPAGDQGTRPGDPPRQPRAPSPPAAFSSRDR